MKKFLLICAIVGLPSVAHANDLYVEGAVGISFIGDIDTETYSATIPNVGSGSIGGTLEYDEALTFGAEVGISNVAGSKWRLGVSWDHVEAELDQASVSGTLNGQPFSGSIPSSTLQAAGLDFDNSINVISGNIYYDVELPINLDWYLGAGIGYADVENADGELAFSAITGVNYWFNPNFAIGAKYKFTYIDSLEDDLGIEYDSIKNNALLATLTVKFGGTE